MKLVYLLLHDFRFASIGLEEFAFHRFHFSKEYARRMAQLGHEVKLYVMSGEIARKKILYVDGYELKAFRPSFHFPPFMRFGNTHSVEVMAELEQDASQADIVAGIRARTESLFQLTCAIRDVALLEEHAPNRWRERQRFPLRSS